MTNDEEEIDCANRFLPFFNVKNSTNFYITKKNEIQNQIDVFAYNDKDDFLKLQITKADYLDSYVYNKNKNDRIKGKTEDIEVLFRDKNDIEPCVQAIKNKIDKYKGRKIDDIILLLDDVRMRQSYYFEKRFLNKKNDNLKGFFREIWYVGGENSVYRIF
ncbi:MAG: hypothetical protein WA092_00535 [Minisyncoccales bacterium]